LIRQVAELIELTRPPLRGAGFLKLLKTGVPMDVLNDILLFVDEINE
jgi:hypothetical protein